MLSSESMQLLSDRNESIWGKEKFTRSKLPSIVLPTNVLNYSLGESLSSALSRKGMNSHASIINRQTDSPRSYANVARNLLPGS
jgi:hypothetical protein